MGASMQPVFNNFVRFVTINHELARKRRRFSIPPGKNEKKFKQEID
jgi:hypothetical protein